MHTAPNATDRLRDEVAEACAVLVDGPRGHVTPAVANRLLQLVEDGDTTAGAEVFFEHLLVGLAPDPDDVDAAIDAWRSSRTQDALLALSSATEPPRQALLRSLTLADDGPFRLVSLRAELLDLIEQRPALAAVDHDFLHLFRSWFTPGFLALREVSWDSPSSLVAHILEYESVHPMLGWAELRSRLEPVDRTCFAFVHPAMGERPLIFVEVAIGDELPSDIDSLTTPSGAPAPNGTVATLYSINNTFRGLRGVNFGNHLIKQVIADVRRRSPQISTFATLSPVPGLRDWLEGEALEDPEVADLLQDLHATSTSGDPAAVERLRPRLVDAARHYLLERTADDGRPLDRVARFHLANGATLERVNWPAGQAPHLFDQSFGLMVNYRYDAQEAS